MLKYQSFYYVCILLSCFCVVCLIELHRVLGDQLDKVLEDYDVDKCHHFLSAEGLAEPQTAAAVVTKAETNAVSIFCISNTSC